MRPGDEQLGQGDDRVLVAGLELERLRRLASSPARDERGERRLRSVGSSDWTNCSTSRSGSAPTKPSTTWPLCIAYTAGIDWAWNARRSRVLVDVDLGEHDLSVGGVDRLLEIGPSVRHGPHHGAHRSMTTGTVADFSSTSAANVASVTSMAMPFTLEGPRRKSCPAAYPCPTLGNMTSGPTR